MPIRSVSSCSSKSWNTLPSYPVGASGRAASQNSGKSVPKTPHAACPAGLYGGGSRFRAARRAMGACERFPVSLRVVNFLLCNEHWLMKCSFIVFIFRWGVGLVNYFYIYQNNRQTIKRLMIADLCGIVIILPWFQIFREGCSRSSIRVAGGGWQKLFDTGVGSGISSQLPYGIRRVLRWPGSF